MSLIFEWDQNKSKENIRKHKISFEEAKTVFNDPLSITIVDHEHSASEERFIDMGVSSRGQLLAVVYTERGNRIRIISSRLATRKERGDYEEVMR
jgi:uncharacterized DUF497 family protein